MSPVDQCKIMLTQSFSGQYFYWIPVFMGMGIFSFFMIPVALDIWLCCFVALLMGVLGCFCFKAERMFLAVPLFALTLIMIGLCLMQFRVNALDTVFIKKEAIHQVTGTVGAIEPLEKNTRVVLKHVSLEKTGDFKADIRLQSYHAQGLAVGDRVSVLTKLRPPSPPVYPDGFDFSRYAFFRGWGAVGFTLSEFDVLEKAPEQGIGHFFFRLRNAISLQLDSIENRQAAAVAKALLVGQRQAIDEDTLEAVRDAGLAHLLSISGLHVGLMAGFVFLLIRSGLALIPFIALRYPIKKIAAVFALLAAIFYMLLVGAPIPTQRAVVMTGLVFIAVLFDRTAISFRTAAFAALIIMFVRPEAITEVSFQLSFAAVLSLIAFYEWAYKRIPKDFYNRHLINRMAFYFVGVVVTSLIASIATMPFTLYHFQSFPLLGIVSNLAAIPLVSFVIMPAGLLSMLSMPFNMAAPFLFVMQWGIEGVISIAEYTASFDIAVIRLPQISDLSVVLCVFGSFVLMLTRAPIRAYGFIPLLLGLVLMPISKMPDVLLSDDAGLMGVYKDKALYLSDTRRDKYIAENWADYLGLKKERVRLLDQCDHAGCVLDIKGRRVAYLFNQEALSEECSSADIVLARFHIENSRACSADIVIDRIDVWKHGAYALWLGDVIDIRTVKEVSVR